MAKLGTEVCCGMIGGYRTRYDERRVKLWKRCARIIFGVYPHCAQRLRSRVEARCWNG